MKYILTSSLHHSDNHAFPPLSMAPPCADAEAVAQASKAKATRGWRGGVESANRKTIDGVRQKTPSE